MPQGQAPSWAAQLAPSLSSPGSLEVRPQVQVQVWAFWGEGCLQQHRDGPAPRSQAAEGHTESQDVRQRAVGIDALGRPEAGVLQGVQEGTWGEGTSPACSTQGHPKQLRRCWPFWVVSEVDPPSEPQCPVQEATAVQGTPGSCQPWTPACWGLLFCEWGILSKRDNGLGGGVGQTVATCVCVQCKGLGQLLSCPCRGLQLDIEGTGQNGPVRVPPGPVVYTAHMQCIMIHTCPQVRVGHGGPEPGVTGQRVGSEYGRVLIGIRHGKGCSTEWPGKWEG